MQFRELRVHVKATNILQALCQDGLPPPESGRPAALARGCFRLCACLCEGNARNAYLFYPRLDLFLKYLADPGGLRLAAHEAVDAMFRDNRLLCTQSSHVVRPLSTLPSCRPALHTVRLFCTQPPCSAHLRRPWCTCA